MSSVEPLAGIEIEDLSLSVAGKPLLERARASFPGGKITLLIGASGAGKTIFLNTIAGLEDSRTVAVQGKVTIAGEDRLRANPRIGIVFQSFALFDELGCAGNIAFALDHRRPRSRIPVGQERERAIAELIDEFRIPSRVPVQALSGGQKQRLAVARTLALDPPVIIYDEPTSGLDPANAQRVAQRIRETGLRHGKTSVIVSHDYERLAPVSDKIYVLDPDTRSLREVDPDEIAARRLVLPGSGLASEEPARTAPALPARAASAVMGFLETSGAAALAALSTVFQLVPRWRSWRWGARYLLHYGSLLGSPSAWLYFSFAGLIAGFVATYFSFRFLPHSRFTEPLIADEMLQALGMVLYRIVVPVLTTVLLAARSGAAVASDVGHRSYTQQLQAMLSFAVRPPSYLLTSILFAFAVVTPLLVVAAFLASQATSLLVFLYNHPEKGAYFWESHFHHDLRVPGSWIYYGTAWLAAKVLLCGLGVGSIAYHVGAAPKKSGLEVSRGVTSTIIWSTLYVLLVHFAFAFFEFEDLR